MTTLSRHPELLKLVTSLLLRAIWMGEMSKLA
jgi:hypothetical protein